MTNIFINLDRHTSLSLQQQLTDGLRQQILNGMIKGGQRLPSSRMLAQNLGISRIVCLYAYEQLAAEGYLSSKTGVGTLVEKGIQAASETHKKLPRPQSGPNWFPPAKAEKPSSHPAKIDFSMGRPVPGLIDEKAWKRAWRWALSRPLEHKNTPAAGILDLRQAIAGHVQVSRGIDCSPENIIITSGAVDIINLMARITRTVRPHVYLENPGFTAAWNSFKSYGHRISPVAIDEQGLLVSRLPKGAAQPALVFCTPSHQFPLGFRMSAKRRLALLDWASDENALILEDDYDSEFRYDGAPLPTLKTQDRQGHVVYFSSLSKSLTPSIRLGYLIGPNNITRALAQEIGESHLQPPLLLQQAMAYFIQKGELDKHMRRARRHYSALNKIMRQELVDLPPHISCHGLEGGLHAFMHFPKEYDLVLLQDQLARDGIKIDSLNKRQHAPSEWHGLVLGYGHMGQEELRQGLREMRHHL